MAKTDSIVLTAILGCLVTKDLVWSCEGIRLNHVQLGIFPSSTVDVLTFSTWRERKIIIAFCIKRVWILYKKVRRNNSENFSSSGRDHAFIISGSEEDLTGHHRDGAAGGAWLLAVLLLGLYCLFQLLDLHPDLFQDSLQHNKDRTWFMFVVFQTCRATSYFISIYIQERFVGTGLLTSWCSLAHT